MNVVPSSIRSRPAAEAPTHWIERLAGFAAGQDIERAPEAVRRKVRHILLDTLGAMIGGLRQPENRTLATRLGVSADGISPLALFVLGTAGVALELDEGCAASRGHPGIHVVPAAIAAAVRHGIDGAELLSAVLAGYETAARLGSATTFRPGIHPHGTWGSCGAAVAQARAAGLGEGPTAAALAMAANLVVATHYGAVHAGATVRNAWSGMGNLAGFLALELAQSGFEPHLGAPADVFGATLGSAFDGEIAIKDLGQRWLILGNYFKPHACCRHAHAAVDALARAVAARRPAPAEIETVEIAAYGRAVEATGRPDRPRSPLAAKFSLPYIAATYFLEGDLSDAAFREPRLSSPVIAELAAKVTVIEDPALTAMLPGVRAARARVRLTDGTVLSGEAEGSRGDPTDPLSEDELIDKFGMLTEPTLGSARARRLASSILDPGERLDPNDLWAALLEHNG